MPDKPGSPIWGFGESKDNPEKEHPDIYFGDLDRAVNKPLSPYEIKDPVESAPTWLVLGGVN